MRVSLKVIVPSLLAAGLFPGLVEGQLIEVRRGYVRAPFVRVQRGRVRAPFVELGDRQATPQYGTPQYATPSYGTSALRPPPAPPAEPEPTAVAAPVDAAPDVTQMDAAELEHTILAGEAELSRELDQLAAGDYWRGMLHVGRLRDVLTDEDVAIEADERRTRLQQILDAYHQALVSPAARPVAGLAGFQTVQPALRELLLSPAERQLGRVAAASRALEVELMTMQNGAIWAEHLCLPPTLVHGTAADAERIDELTPLLSRFDAAAGNPRNRPVTGLATFRTMHESLGEYVDLLTEASTPVTEAVSLPEPVSANKPGTANEPVVIRQRRDLTPTPAGNLSR